MALGTGYDQQGCYLARALEVVGERWTLLILRDLFYGVRRFTDLREHLDISRAVLTARLDHLVEAGVVVRDGHTEYQLTEAGRALWPTIHALSTWGAQYTTGAHPARIFSHAECDTELDQAGRCPTCDVTPGADAVIVRPGAGPNTMRRTDRVARALERPHRMLTPL